VARLWFGLSQLAVTRLAGHGFVPVVPPVLVREAAMEGTGFFPGDRASVYELPDDGLCLVGTSEVPLAALHQDEVLDEASLPLRYCGISSCFRREAGAAGRDTRGIFRTHQFEKVEMFSFCHPDRSWDEHEWLLSIEEELAQTLGLHYRVMNIAAGDLGDSAAKKYDLEVWLPGQDRYRELTSCSNCTDYQARRLNCRFRPTAGGAPRPLHTLNGTAVTSSRTIIAILETHQREDGTVAVPAALPDLRSAGRDRAAALAGRRGGSRRLGVPGELAEEGRRRRCPDRPRSPRGRDAARVDAPGQLGGQDRARAAAPTRPRPGRPARPAARGPRSDGWRRTCPARRRRSSPPGSRRSRRTARTKRSSSGLRRAQVLRHVQARHVDERHARVEQHPRGRHVPRQVELGAVCHVVGWPPSHTTTIRSAIGRLEQQRRGDVRHAPMATT
jgi:hypothetical protein